MNLKNVFTGLAVALAVILIVNIILTFNVSSQLRKSTEEIREKQRPAKIELTVIKNSKCNDCFNISPILNIIKSSKVNITKETTFEFDTQESKEILSKYKIDKVPTVIVTGEIDRANIQGLDKKESALIFSNIAPPYTSTATGKIEGHVILFHLTEPECLECSDLLNLLTQIKTGGVKFFEEKKITADSDEGKELIQKYNIGFVPALILSKDLQPYATVEKVWTQVGTKESDGSYVLRSPNPPFINLTTKELKGLVTMTYLIDSTCAQCYDVSVYKRVLENPKGYSIHIDKEEKIDIKDAKELIVKYNITQVPTVILSDEVGFYPSKQALKQFFSVEKDNSYVFRKVSILGIYKDLTTNQIINKSAAQQ